MSNKKNVSEKIISPLLSWDVYAMFLYEQREKVTVHDDLSALLQLHKQHQWQIELEELLEQPYEALVVTDIQQVICWVNDGFEKMTGYTPSFAIGRKPIFLQGKNTSMQTKSEIRQQLAEKKACQADIINYRKNGEEYMCHVEIVPVFNYLNQHTHFLALERERELS